MPLRIIEHRTIPAFPKTACLTFFCLLLQLTSYANDLEPERSKGISIHLTPERVVQMANDKSVQRFIVMFEDQEGTYRAEDSEAGPLIEHIKSLPQEFQQNGIWLVLTHPDSYTDRDRAELSELERLAQENGIPLFESRASELPNGWRRVEKR